MSDLIRLHIGDHQFLVHEHGDRMLVYADAAYVGELKDEGAWCSLRVIPCDSSEEAAKLVTTDVLSALGWALKAAQGARAARLENTL